MTARALLCVLALTLSGCQYRATIEIVRCCGDSALYRSFEGDLYFGPINGDGRFSPVAKDANLERLCP